MTEAREEEELSGDPHFQVDGPVAKDACRKAWEFVLAATSGEASGVVQMRCLNSGRSKSRRDLEESPPGRAEGWPAQERVGKVFTERRDTGLRLPELKELQQGSWRSTVGLRDRGQLLSLVNWLYSLEQPICVWH